MGFSLNMDSKKQKILKFVRKQKFAVLSTASNDGVPQAALMTFSENQNLELFFDTFCASRKAKNLHLNSKVAIVIGLHDPVSVQYEGMAYKLKDEELRESQEIHVSKLPESEMFIHMEDSLFFKIIPRWIRYSDTSKQPWEIFEIEL